MVDVDYYENLVNINKNNKDTIFRALDMVRQFIMDEKLIIKGGMAIDYALKLKGKSIYDDNQIPDYDFLTPTPAEHAYKLSQILCREKFPNVSCIPALYVTTMRVKVDFEPVADLDYCPKIIYDKIPTIDFNGLRIIHPHYQIMDMHISLSIPYKYPGMETIFFRWKKDMKRYDLLYEEYPIIPYISLKAPKDNLTLDMSKDFVSQRKQLAKKMTLPLEKIIIEVGDFKNCCFAGWGAVDYEYNNDKLIIYVPRGEPVSLASYDIKEFLKDKDTKNAKYYNSYFGKLPMRVNFMYKNINIEVFDITGWKLSASLLSKKYNVWMCNLQWSMLYLLWKMSKTQIPSIKFMAEEFYIKCRYKIMEDPKWGPSVEVYGDIELSQDTINGRRREYNSIYNIKEVLQPPRAYPKLPECLISETFNYNESPYFGTDGGEIDKKTFEKQLLDITKY